MAILVATPVEKGGRWSFAPREESPVITRDPGMRSLSPLADSRGVQLPPHRSGADGSVPRRRRRLGGSRSHSRASHDPTGCGTVQPPVSARTCRTMPGWCICTRVPACMWKSAETHTAQPRTVTLHQCCAPRRSSSPGPQPGPANSTPIAPWTRCVHPSPTDASHSSFAIRRSCARLFSTQPSD